MGKCCGQGVAGGAGHSSPQSQGQGGKRCVSGSHNEDVCHGTNERRRDLLDQLKIFLDDFDERPCQVTPPQTGPDATRPLGEYPEYMRKHCQSWMPRDPRPPLITSVQSHEIRTTSDFEKLKNDNTEYVSYKDGRAKPPTATCDCAKRNGLQDQCPRAECKPPTPQCLASNPGPCCPPSLGLTGREATASPRPAAPTQTTYQQDFRTPQQTPQGGNFQSVYRGDYGAPKAAACPAGGLAGAAPTAPMQSPQMICFCRVPPSTMPPGKKYLCCPLPE